MTEPLALPQIAGSTSLGDQLRTSLQKAIIDGAFAPGAHLNADDIAAHYGVSRIPVREALRALHADGWVEIRPRRGAFVRQRSAKEITQLFEVRHVLEAQAARWAAQRRDDAQLIELDRIVQVGNKAVRAGDLQRITELNGEFHALVSECAGNDVLAEVLRSLSARVQWYFAAVATHRATASWHEHAALVETLRNRDTEGAARLARHHTDATRRALQEMLEDTPD